jgi:arsenate reductase
LEGLLLRIVRTVNDNASDSQYSRVSAVGHLLALARQSGYEAQMKATIWHNPNCGTSRNTLALLEAAPGIELTVVEYLKHPPATEKLAQLYRDAGIAPREGLRLRGTDAGERGLTSADDAAVLAAMAADPILIERPLVETGKGVRLCRPAEKVHEIL